MYSQQRSDDTLDPNVAEFYARLAQLMTGCACAPNGSTNPKIDYHTGRAINRGYNKIVMLQSLEPLLGPA